MSQYAKDLTKNVQILLKRKSQQFMLTRILTKPEFLPFLEGEKTIRVFSPQKQMFNALLRVENGPNASYRLEPRGVIPPGVDKGTILLLVFASEKENYIVQCVIETFSFLSIGIKSLDPRISARRLTFLPATFFRVSDEVFSEITHEKVLVRRIVEQGSENGADDRQVCRDIFVNPVSPADDIIDPVSAFGDSEHKSVGILTDISSGGCCIQLKNASNPKLDENLQFGVVKFDIPIGDGRGGALAVLIRQFRRGRGCTILHCMFLEPLPSEFLAV